LADTCPDFVIDTGDNLASATALPTLARALGPLSGRPGVFVLGSNDFHAPGPVNPLRYLVHRKTTPSHHLLPTPALIATLNRLGWASAEEQRLIFDLNGSRIEVRGCGDAHLGRDNYPSVMGPLAADTDLLIGVTHSPYRAVLDQMVADGAGLLIAGHTHGGQVCLPGGHALTTNCDLPRRQAKGLSRHRFGPASAYLHVSAGLGTSPYAPYRFCCPPEATLITLTPRPIA
jgi:predicted MPP superfamily phosphohydrolase